MGTFFEPFMGHIPDLLDLNVTASFVILFVICVRKLMKRAPKIFSYALWGIVLLRLLIPVSIESPMSFLPERKETSAMVEINEVLPEIRFETPRDRADNAQQIENPTPGEPITHASGSFDAETYLTFLWFSGMAVMIIRGGISYGKLRRRVKVSVRLRNGIYIADDIDIPFVMGIFRPVIYLPGSLQASERKYIIAHERHHIRRGDHIFKAVGYLALSIHWFNPLVWVAFGLANRDMEMSCDEAVIRKLGEEIRAEYSSSLLNLASGYRLFTGTPLAFGEGDPTGRVRNLAMWKKPAIWVSVICVAACILLALCLLTDPEADAASPLEIVEAEPSIPEETRLKPMASETDWGVTISPDRVSRTGATALFVYSGSVPGEAGAELTYGDYLSLDHMVNGEWIPCDELAGYDYYVSDSSYPVVDGYGMVHEWENRFGALVDGHYRLGKMVTLERPDGSKEVRMIYGEFSLPESIPTGPIPLENLPENYSAEEAMIDGCLVSRDGDAMDNIDAFIDFYEACYRGEPGFFRTLNYTYGDDPHFVVQDITFDGSKYLLSVMDSRDRWIRSAEYRHLKYFSVEEQSEDVPYDALECYMLVDDNNVKWEEFPYSRHRSVFENYIYYPQTPQLPDDPAEAILEFEGTKLVTVTDYDRLEKIWILFEEAEILGYEPKTHSIGVGLNLILKSRNGDTVIIELDPDSDICRINGAYFFYGAFEEPDYIEKLWYYLGIEAWPDAVYESCENAFRS